MKKIAALDVGDVKIGIALMDEEVKIAFPYTVLRRTGTKIEQELKKVAETENITQFVVGLPLSENGQENSQCEKVRRFCKRLEARVKVPIIFYDEYGTSMEARQIVGKNKKDEDAESAALMLQRYADSTMK